MIGKNLPKSEILEGCKNNDRKSQEILYKAYYTPFINLVKNEIEDAAEECLNRAFLSIFKNIKSYNYEMPFDDWITSFVNEAIRNNKISQN